MTQTQTRREFVVAAAAAVAAATNLRVSSALAGDAPPLYRSRPDLTPPKVTVTTAARNVAPGLALLAPFGETAQHGLLIVDNRGEPVWFRPVTDATTVGNLQMQTFGGKPVLTWWQGNEDGNGDFLGDCVIADTAYNVIKVISVSNGYQTDVHEFLITDRDTALITMSNLYGADLSSVGGPADATVIEGVFQEVDLASGKVLLEWHSGEHVGFDESYFPATSVWDYFHINSVDVDSDGQLLVSSRYTSAVYKVDRTTGEIIWRLNGKRSDFAMGPGTVFNFQHDARGHAGGLVSVFDDGAYTNSGPGEPESVSRALLLSLDMAAMTCSLVRSMPNPDGKLTIAMGNAQRLDDEGFMVGWGTVPSLTEFDANGTVRFEADLPKGVLNYRAFRAPWVGRPSVPPAVAAQRAADGSVELYASWNGATEVARWRVLGAARRGERLRGIEEAPRAAFETRIRVASPPAIVAVAALDSAGAQLGRSRLVSL
jgi:Arylsulfotransferase (ASST)